MYKKFNKKRKIFFKEIGLEAFSIIFATIYFILNSCYKLYMSTRYGIPYNFFSLDLSFLTIATLLFIIVPFLEIKIGLSFKNDINNWLFVK